MSLITDTVLTYLPRRRKKTPSGWISFNAVCCIHNGNSLDTRQRGGLMITDGVTYHCFNCGFKASWQPGRSVSQKLKKLMRWLGVPDDNITKCSLEALRIQENSEYQSKQSFIPKFVNKSLPKDSQLLSDQLENPDVVPLLEYLASRKLYLDDYTWYWSTNHNFNSRLIIPFYYENNIVGYTARLLRNGKPKYISEQQPGYVFNIDRQHDDKKYCIVTEGPLDAISIDGVALLGAEIKQQQQALIGNLKKEIILVPDRDREGQRTVEQAVELGWAVSFPEWKDCKDVNDACCKYGRLSTLYDILTSKESNPLKIKIYAKKWFKEHL